MEKEHRKPLSRDIIRKGLSHLGPNVEGQYAYLKLDLIGQNLVSSVGIENYRHLQHIDLSNNQLVSLKSLSSIKHLLTLNVAHNALTKLPGFEAPANLLYADFSYNQITEIGNLEKFNLLQRLYLDGNQITEIKGLDSLENLQVLSLNENKIVEIGNLTYQTNLELLNLAKNEIQTIAEGFETLVNLRVLDISNNKIKTMRGLHYLECLRYLNFENNLIHRVNAVEHIKDLPLLSDLELSGNAMQQKPQYRFQVIFKLPCIRSLDGEEVTAEEKIKAENFHGLDLEDRETIYSDLFPYSTFTDRRLATVDQIDAESNSEDELDQVQSRSNQITQGTGNASFSSRRSSRSRRSDKPPSRIRSDASMDSFRNPKSLNDVHAVARQYVGDIVGKYETDKKVLNHFQATKTLFQFKK